VDAVSGVAQSGEAQVTILEVGHPQQIADALRRDRYHVLHLSAQGRRTAWSSRMRTASRSPPAPRT
jgi:hypothetical protein